MHDPHIANGNQQAGLSLAKGFEDRVNIGHKVPEHDGFVRILLHDRKRNFLIHNNKLRSTSTLCMERGKSVQPNRCQKLVSIHKIAGRWPCQRCTLLKLRPSIP